MLLPVCVALRRCLLGSNLGAALASSPVRLLPLPAMKHEATHPMHTQVWITPCRSTGRGSCCTCSGLPAGTSSVADGTCSRTVAHPSTYSRLGNPPGYLPSVQYWHNATVATSLRAVPLQLTGHYLTCQRPLWPVAHVQAASTEHMVATVGGRVGTR
jgi:hypothetical protein